MLSTPVRAIALPRTISATVATLAASCLKSSPCSSAVLGGKEDLRIVRHLDAERPGQQCLALFQYIVHLDERPTRPLSIIGHGKQVGVGRKGKAANEPLYDEGKTIDIDRKDDADNLPWFVYSEGDRIRPDTDQPRPAHRPGKVPRDLQRVARSGEVKDRAHFLAPHLPMLMPKTSRCAD